MDLRTWSLEYFSNEIIYDSSLFMTLNKVKESIANELNRDTPLGYEREFDLIVKIEEIDEESVHQSQK